MVVIPYDALGGEPFVRRLVDRFYDLMDEVPEARELRDLHAPDLGEARQKLFEFLSGWLGGPQLYVQKYGHPRLRMRHFRVPIATRERDQWMLCMTRALDELVPDPDLRASLTRAFAGVADHMRNQPDLPAEPGRPA
ncbi:MAG TPA: group II truncated hemoglobin [Nannocystaceae bacterium]|nr:group II truncated hemoglobin [Nannocystaceae bacterium]